MTESKTAGCEAATPAVEGSKETNQIVSKIHLQKARSKLAWEKKCWMSLFFRASFLDFGQYWAYFI
jgi:hypothetical protein